MSDRARAWLVAALSTGAVTWLLARFFGAGPLRRDAWLLGLLVGLLVLGGQWLRLRAPRGRRARDNASLGRGAKQFLLLLFAGVAAYGGYGLVDEARVGYRPIPKQAVLDGASLPNGFYVAEGKPIVLPADPALKVPEETVMYRLKGPEGERYLTPLDAYAGRVLVVTDLAPPSDNLQVTGGLRDDLRTVQSAPGGPIPFLAEYRRMMNLPADARILFLDTSLRAGANVRTVVLFLVPLYLFLLVLGAPTRRR